MLEELAVRERFPRWWMKGKNKIPLSSNEVGKNASVASQHLNSKQQLRLTTWNHDRTVNNKPLQYCLRNQPFASHPIPLLVRPPVLIPRWETEEWTMHLASIIKPRLQQLQHSAGQRKRDPFRILDICSGSGCISLGLAYLLDAASPLSALEIIGIDKSDRAVKLARVNQRLWGIPPNRLSFIQGDIFNKEIWPTDEDSQKFDLIVSNPPYIPLDEWEGLSPDVKHWEDKDALVGHGNGIAPQQDPLGISFYRWIVSNSRSILRQNLDPCLNHLPRLVMEYGGEKQTQALQEIFKENGYTFTIWKDLAGKERCIVSQNNLKF